MSGYSLPDHNQVRDLLGMLFDGLVVKPGGKLDTSAASTAYAGVYVADDGAPVAICACDLAFGACGGAALSILPAAAAKESLAGNKLTDMMAANLREIMNICTRLLLREGTLHLRLGEVCPIKSLPAPAAAILKAASSRADFEIGLGKYGTGRIAVLL